MPLRLAASVTALLLVLAAGPRPDRSSPASIPGAPVGCSGGAAPSVVWSRLAAHIPQPVSCAALYSGGVAGSSDDIAAGVLDQFPNTALQLNGDLAGLALDPSRVHDWIASCHQVAGPSQPALVTPNQRKPYFVLVCPLPLTP